jgi:hypothetical protein
MKLLSMFRGLIAATLMVSVLIAYGLGSFVTFEIEHHHHANGDHHHTGQEHLLVHHDDASHHDPVNAPDGEQEGDDDPAGSHSHSFSFGVDGPFACPSGCSASPLGESDRSLDFHNGGHCPDDPCYDLIKPPQLG